ncbi:DUF397 domain-containing protein [Streptomyces sp. NPDC012935]|uniref:DUF397 domain-containing protein n=1 Tax=Streptomyces sp. NPDC012935 TaxID=3364857 RepID=UPI0036B20709
MTPHWRTSTYMGTENCVEVADSDPSMVMIRDTKAPIRGMLAVQRDAWTPFVGYAKQG